MLHYLMVAEKTSAKFKKLDLQRKRRKSFRSDHILELMGRLERSSAEGQKIRFEMLNAPLDQADSISTG
jgi:hypothetical protein